MTETLHRSTPFDLPDHNRAQTVEALQTWLPGLVATALRLKQAHWNLRGRRFKSIHEQLDEILVDVREAVDDVAERIVTVGGAADGLPATVSTKAELGDFPSGLLTVEQAIGLVCDDLAAMSRRGRSAMAKLAEVDPISEDLAIGIVSAIEKHHWMLTSQLGGPSD